MTNYRFILEPYAGIKSRFRCPECNHSTKTFKRYIDTQTNQYLADHVGKCDREDKCGYHYKPRDYFFESPNNAVAWTKPTRIKPVINTYNTIPKIHLDKTMGNEKGNNFLCFLSAIFGKKSVIDLAGKYNIGTSVHWPGSTIFWQMDISGKLRTGKVMLYDSDNCRRVKDPFNHIAWMHSVLYASTGTDHDFTLKQCFFGEHLLALEPDKPVAIAESEKTAVMASIMMPDFIWLAAGNVHGLDEHKCRVLKNRSVLLFPDVGAYYHWAERARILNQKIPTATFNVHEEMERTATFAEHASGADMADRWIEEWFSEIGGRKLEVGSPKSDATG